MISDSLKETSTSVEVEDKEEIIITPPKQDFQEQIKDDSEIKPIYFKPLILLIGGVVIGIIIMRFITLRKIRFKQNDTNLSADQTISLHDSKDTTILSVKEN